MSFLSSLLKTNPRELLKNKSIRKNLGNSFFYFGGSLIQFIIAIFTQPIYSRYLELQDFAIIGYFTAIQAILFPLFNMSLPFYYLTKYWKNDNETNPEKNLSFILNFLNIANVLIAIIAFITLSYYFNVFHITFPLVPFIFIVFANLYFEKYKTYYLIECRVQKKGKKFFFISLLQIIINTSFSVYFLVSLNGGAIGRMSGIMLGAVVTGSVTLFLLLREKKYSISYHINGEKIKSALKYCIPLIISSYAYYPIGNIDRLFLERIGNTYEYGYYIIGLRIASFIGTLYLALYQSFEPDLYKLITQKKYKHYILFTFFYIVALSLIALVFVFFSPTVVSYLTSGRYTYASTYANIFVIGLVLMQVGGLYEQLFTAFSATQYVMWWYILMGVFCVITYFFMIQYYQFYGASVTRVIAAMFYIVSGSLLFLIFIKRRKNEK